MPGIILLIIFTIVPSIFTVIMAFQKYIIGKGWTGSPWVWFSNIKFMFQIPDSKVIFTNTLIIAVSKIILNLLVPVIFALMLNELRSERYSKVIRTIIYLPHFLSWVILSGLIVNIFSFEGIVNSIVKMLGHDPIMFMASNKWMRPLIILSDVWKEFGFGTIVYVAAIVGINPKLYETAVIDGAGRFKQMWYITLPSLAPIIMLMAILSIGNVLNAGFEQIFNLYNPLVYDTVDIIDTYVYRVGLLQRQYSLSAAVDLTKSVISLVLIITAHGLAYKFSDHRIF